MGVCTIAPAIGSGRISAQACKQMAVNPEHHMVLSRTSFLGQGLIETAVIYGFIIALALIFTQ